jgi:hypothetical protein
MKFKYNWIHIPTGKHGTSHFTLKMGVGIPRVQALEHINKWNTLSANSPSENKFIYWLDTGERCVK